MRKTAIVLGGVAIAVAAALWWFRPLSRADRIATEVGSQDQSRLWHGVRDRRLLDDLDRLASVETILTNRQRPLPASQTSPQPEVRIPERVRTTIILVRASDPGEWSYIGNAKVENVAGERGDLQLSNGRTLSFVARVNGKPLPVRNGDLVEVEYRARPDPLAPERILAVRARDGTAIASVTQSGNKELTVSLTLLNVQARQTGKADRGAMSVVVVPDATGKGEPRLVMPGKPVEANGVSVSLLGSVVRPPNSPADDGPPYTLSFIAWRTPVP